MKKLIIISTYLAFILFAVSCKSGSTKATNKSEMQENSTEFYYTCEMHPEVVSEKPGNCPKCGMELIKMEGAMPDSTKMHQMSDSMQMK